MAAVDGLCLPDLADRLDALRQLVHGAPAPAVRGCDLSVSTGHGHSIRTSPSAAVWSARQGGMGLVGLSDHLSTAAAAEFTQACAIAGLPDTLGVEAEACDPSLADARAAANDPTRPGRIRLCARALTWPQDQQAQDRLARLRGLQEERCQATLERIDLRFRTTVGAAGPAWSDVHDLTMSGNTGVRHVTTATLERIRAVAVERSMPAGDAFRAVVGAAPQGGDGELLALIDTHLLAIGRPCHVPVEDGTLPSVSMIRNLFLRLGGIPTYPFLGDPVTRAEEDVRSWCDRLASWGIHALEVAPACGEARTSVILDEAARRGWPVFEAGCPPDRRSIHRGLYEGSLVALGHQCLVCAGQTGYVGQDGLPTPDGRARCLSAARARIAAG